MSAKETIETRGNRYGSFENNAKVTQNLIEVIKHSPNYDLLSQVHLEAFHMIFHKIARCVCGDSNYIDNATDMAGYALRLEEYLIELNAKVDENEVYSFKNPR